jgi:iron complex transport system substrate-binding protein
MRATQALAIAMVLVAIATFFIGYYAAPTKTITTTQTVAYTVTTTFTQAITPTITPSTLTVTQTVVKEVSRHEVKYPITIVDSAGRTVTIEKEPQRVVAQFFHIRGGLLALGIVDRIVGTDDYVLEDPIYRPLLRRDVVSIGRYPPSAESILVANPDLVILITDCQKWEYEKRLPQNVKVVYFNLFLDPETLFDEIYKLGLIFNKVDKALELIQKWSSRFAYIVGKASGVKPSEKVRVALIAFPERGSIMVAGSGNCYGGGGLKMITLAGGINVFGDSPQPCPVVGPEAIIERNPDVIIAYVSYSYYDPCTFNTSKPLEDVYKLLISMPGWDRANAVRNNRVYVYTLHRGHTGLGLIPGLAWIAKFLYPQLFKELDPVEWVFDWLRDNGVKEPDKVCKLPWAYPAILSK